MSNTENDSDGYERRDHHSRESEGHSFEPHASGFYLLAVESVHDGYLIDGRGDELLVPNVMINGRYIGTSGRFETECDGVEVTKDGALNLRYNGENNGE